MEVEYSDFRSHALRLRSEVATYLLSYALAFSLFCRLKRFYEGIDPVVRVRFIVGADVDDVTFHDQDGISPYTFFRIAACWTIPACQLRQEKAE